MTGPEYRALRLALGLTQRELAERLGVRENTIWRRENGQREISPEAELALYWIQQEIEGYAGLY